MKTTDKRQFKFFSLVWDELYPNQMPTRVFESLKDTTISNIRYEFKKVPFSDEFIDQIVLKTLNLIIRNHCKENNYVPFKLKKSKLTGMVVGYIMEKRACSKCHKLFWWLTEIWDSRDIYCSLECKGEIKDKYVAVSSKKGLKGYQVNELVTVIKIK